MNGSMLFPVMTGSNLFSGSLFSEDFLSNFFNGDFPEGTKVYKKDILDSEGNKIGQKTVRTFSSGKSHAPREVVSSNFPPMNNYIDENKRLVYEFAVAGYDPKNVSFEVNEENPDYIDLVLKSELEVVHENDSADSEEEETTTKESKAYLYEGFKTKDARTSFFVDTRKYDLEDSEMEFKNGVVTISFGPNKKLSTFKPKLVE